VEKDHFHQDINKDLKQPRQSTSHPFSTFTLGPLKDSTLSTTIHKTQGSARHTQNQLPTTHTWGLYIHKVMGAFDL
jgi:hypothetical protein